ncbi:MAG: hypothetical protein HGA99_08275 [Chlorobiaceae bacterium]|nr:hypothetical protein [Chlorobiaceae bacterium]
MERASLLQRLQAIQQPTLLDGGYWRLGHTLFIVTAKGLITVDCRVYDPILGPIEYSEKHCSLIAGIAAECDTLQDNSDLDPDEKLFLFNNGKPAVQYWAFQPKDDAALDEYSFSSEKSEIESAFINHYLGAEIEAWDTMDDKSLTMWAGKIEKHGRTER